MRKCKRNSIICRRDLVENLALDHCCQNVLYILFGRVGIYKAKPRNRFKFIACFPFCRCDQCKAFAVIFVSPVSVIFRSPTDSAKNNARQTRFTNQFNVIRFGNQSSRDLSEFDASFDCFFIAVLCRASPAKTKVEALELFALVGFDNPPD